MVKEISITSNESNREYTKEKGFGVWKCEMADLEYGTDSEISLKSGGWNKRRLAEDSFTKEETTSEEVKKRDVTIIKIDVPEFGTYKVNLKMTAVKRAVKGMTLFAGRRNIIDMAINLSAKDDSSNSYDKEFYQAVTPYIPALASKRCNDKCIFISYTGEGCEADNLDITVSVIREDVPVIWVAGDSTLTDQNAGIPYYPYGSCCGWAQTISRYAGRAAVCNLSHSGMTSNCFRDDGHYDIALEMMKAGDIFIIQFGHNDQKRRNLAAFGGYRDNLKKYVAEVRQKGAEPVICSPISRVPAEISYDDAAMLKRGEKYYSLLKMHSEASRQVAQDMDVPFVNLHDYTFRRWIELGERSRDYFMKGDITHTNEYGAVFIADFFVSEIKKKSEDVKKILDDKTEPFIFEPDGDTKDLPRETPGPDLFEMEPPYVDIKGIPEYEDIKKAFRYGLLDPCVMYLHPYAVMPRAQLLMVMFKAFRMAGKRPYMNVFKDVYFDEWDSGYVQALYNEKLIDKSTVNFNSVQNSDDAISKECFFRPDDALTYEEFASFLIRFMEKDIAKRDIPMKECYEKAKKLGFIGEGFKAKGEEKYVIAGGNKIPRAEVYSGLARFMDVVGGTKDELPSDAEIHPVH